MGEEFYYTYRTAFRPGGLAPLARRHDVELIAFDPHMASSCSRPVARRLFIRWAAAFLFRARLSPLPRLQPGHAVFAIRGDR